jgi:hypothetical protein
MILSTLDLSCEENAARIKWNLVYVTWTREIGQFPDDPVKIEVVQIHRGDTPDVLVIGGRKEIEYHGGGWWVTKVVDFVFKTLSPLLVRECVDTKPGCHSDNVVDLVFKTLFQSSAFSGTRGWQTLLTIRCR